MQSHTGFVYGVPSPSRILQSFHSVSARPLKSIQFFISTTLPPSAALYRQRGKTYSLFINGLIVTNFTRITAIVNSFFYKNISLFSLPGVGQFLHQPFGFCPSQARVRNGFSIDAAVRLLAAIFQIRFYH